MLILFVKYINVARLALMQMFLSFAVSLARNPPKGLLRGSVVKHNDDPDYEV